MSLSSRVEKEEENRERDSWFTYRKTYKKKTKTKGKTTMHFCLLS